VRVLIDYRAALRDRSGVGEYTHGLVTALRGIASGTTPPLDLTILSSSWKDRLRVAPELNGVRSIDLRVPVSLLNLAWHRLGWPPAELLTGRRFDVTHSLHPLVLPARAAARIVTIHDVNFLAHPERTRAEIRRDYPALARLHASRADRVIVVSRYTAGQVEQQLGVPRSRISVCSPGAPDWTPDPRRPASGYLLFVGTLEARKNVGTLLDAYERLLGSVGVPELVLAGRETPDARAWLNRVQQPPLAGRVRHLGYVDPADRRALYEGARLLVQPSLDEGFGLPVLEAMTAGIPVVAANRGALPEVLGGAGLLVEPDDPEGMAAALRQLLEDHELARACAGRGVQRARDYRWRDTASRVCEAYQLAVERRAAADAHRH
jgi:glycosyltransferase involved in cell wall biosynthesis